ncbi:MAG: hypothetical protein MI864_06730, partial [Pseudomonadales bacterium]|nr:hypothetical protein [Pseudomonadales bacterium]
LSIGDYPIKLISQALSSISTQATGDLSDLTEQLLSSSSRNRQTVGIAMATSKPSARFLDYLWELHQERCAILDCSYEESQKSSWDLEDHTHSFKALQAGIKINPDWLRQKVKSADASRDRVIQLAYLLHDLEHPMAFNIWNEVKSDLMDKIPLEKPRSLLNCIGRFGDSSQIGFLLLHLSTQKDWSISAAFSSLVKLDPDLAIEKLSETEESELVISRTQWLPQLLHLHPGKTRTKLFEIAKNERRGRRFIERLFNDWPDQLDTALLVFLLRALEADLSSKIETMCQQNAHWITSPLRLLNRINDPNLLDNLRKDAGEDLVSMVLKVAQNCVDSKFSMSQDHVLEECRQFLIRVGGIGITLLVNHELQSANYWGRHDGLRWAFVCPNRDTIKLLEFIGCQAVTLDDNGNPDSQRSSERYHATVALAAVGDDEGLINVIWGDGPLLVANNLDSLRSSPGNIAEVHTKHAHKIINDLNATENDLIKALTLAWLSKDPHFIQPILNLLAVAEPNGHIARMACITLNGLGKTPPEFRQFALPLMRSTNNNRSSAMNILLNMGDQGFSYLAAHLRELPVEKWTASEVSVIEILSQYDEYRSETIQWAVRLYTEQSRFFPFEMPFSLAAESENAKVRELIIKDAFDDDETFVGRKAKIISALAKFDIERAIVANERHLKTSENEVRELAILLTRLSPDDAAYRLIAIAEDRQNSLAAFGHALRKAKAKDVECRLTESISSPSKNIRAVGAELAGWLAPNRLTKVLETMLTVETEEKPRQAALQAINRKHQQEITNNLISILEKGSCDRRWTYIISLQNLADPYLSLDPDDTLCIGRALTNTPEIISDYLIRELEKRKNTIKNN